MAKQVKDNKGAKVAKFKPTDADKVLLKGLTAYATKVLDGIHDEVRAAQDKGQEAINKEAAKVLASLVASHPTVARETFAPLLLDALKQGGYSATQCTRARKALDLPPVRNEGGGRKPNTVEQWSTNVAKQAAEKFAGNVGLVETAKTLVKQTCYSDPDEMKQGNPAAMRERAAELRTFADELEREADKVAAKLLQQVATA